MTIHWKAIEQYFTVVLFVFNFGTVKSERVMGESSSQFHVQKSASYRDFPVCK